MMKEVRIEEGWKRVLSSEFHEAYFHELSDFVHQEYQTTKVFPPAKFVFNAFDCCPFDRVKVIILGQDPYHEPGQAHGLCFSVPSGIPFPPSLRNIYQELSDDIQVSTPITGDLSSWATQGVLLLNSTLTVRAHYAGSHQNRGWERFTDVVIRVLADQKKDLVFILWGAYAQRKAAFVDRSKHLVLTAPHPSPLSSYRGFFGSKPFSQTNAYLISKGITPIQWKIGR